MADETERNTDPKTGPKTGTRSDGTETSGGASAVPPAAPAPQRAGGGVDGRRIRTVIAQVLWSLCALAALFLAVGALLVAVKANTDNALVAFVLDIAEAADLGVFSRTNGPIQFTEGSNAEIKNALVNWGLGALAWLVVGKLLDKLIRPGGGSR